jgi:molybdate transport system substrate-binding protein
MGGNLAVMCARSMTGPVNSIASRFTGATGQRLDISFGTVGALETKLAGGERGDVLILGSPAIARREQAGALVAGSCREIARTAIGVAVRPGAPAPDISTPAAFTAALRAARVVAFSDAAVGGSAGVHLAGLWERMGIADEIRQKSMPQKTGGEVAARVAEGAAELGLTLIAEIVPVKGARVIGRIPSPLGKDAAYAAGISADCPDRAKAAAFIAALVHPGERELWKAAGFEQPE